jgi:hypothetical protein
MAWQIRRTRCTSECKLAGASGAIGRPHLVPTARSNETVIVDGGRDNEIKPGVTIDETVKLRLANDGGGPYFVTDPST